jgi:hypothetical protein
LRRASCLLCLLALPWMAAGQGVPVIDASAIGAAQQNLAALQQQLQQLKSLVQTAQSLVNSVGQAGSPQVAFTQSLSQSGLAQFASQFGASLSAVGGGAPNLSSFAAAQQWVAQNLTSKSNDSASAIAGGRQARAKMAAEAAADGYALALAARQQVAAMAGRAQALAAQVGSAGSLRDDVAANTAIMLAMHDEMAEIEALLAATLALQSSEQLLRADVAPAPIAASGSQ